MIQWISFDRNSIVISLQWSMILTWIVRLIKIRKKKSINKDNRLMILKKTKTQKKNEMSASTISSFTIKKNNRRWLCEVYLEAILSES